jgi:hypothetical protein
MSGCSDAKGGTCANNRRPNVKAVVSAFRDPALVNFDKTFYENEKGVFVKCLFVSQDSHLRQQFHPAYW